MTPADILRAARKKIERPEEWCQFADARGPKGTNCAPDYSDARMFCAMGAILSIDVDLDTRDVALEILRDAIGQGSIHRWNDRETRTHADVMAAFDRAIALAEAS